MALIGGNSRVLDLEKDIPTHVTVRVTHEDGSAFRWPMTAAETRQFCAALLDYADAIDQAHEN